MRKNRVKTSWFGSRKFFETLKFVLRAMVFAFILMHLEKIGNIASAIFDWCTKTDIGYMWVINIAAGSLVVWLISLATRKNRKKHKVLIRIVKVIAFLAVVFLVECLGWHGEETWKMITAPIEATKIVIIIRGVLACTLSFVWHLHGIDYDDDYAGYDEGYGEFDEPDGKGGAEAK